MIIFNIFCFAARQNYMLKNVKIPIIDIRGWKSIFKMAGSQLSRFSPSLEIK